MVKRIIKRVAALGMILVVMLSCGCTTNRAPEYLQVRSTTRQMVFSGDRLKVLTLNLAHGRRDGLNQLFLDKPTIQGNLQQIGLFLKKTDADIVALQEADGPSRWSGGFDHVKMLAELGGYPDYARSSHAVSRLFSYGTALLSRVPFIQVVQHSFQPSPPTTNKGFTMASILWNAPGGREPRQVDIVSVHLDFSRKSVRDRQIREMKQVLGQRRNPRIIMGDFNSDWFADRSVVRTLARDFGLQVYRPEAMDLGTYSSGRRLDWILISRELEFNAYQVMPDILSDHLATVAVMSLKPE